MIVDEKNNVIVNIFLDFFLNLWLGLVEVCQYDNPKVTVFFDVRGRASAEFRCI